MSRLRSARTGHARVVPAAPSRGLTRLDEFIDLLSDDAVGSRIRAAIREETPVYARFADTSEEQEWANGIDGALAMFVACVREGRTMSADERGAMAAIGRRRAEQADMTLDAIEASIRVAIATAYDFVLECGELTSDDGRWALRELSRRLTRYGNDITAAALRAFLARKEELAESRARADARLFDDILGGGADTAEVRHRAAAQGMDFDAAWGAVLVAAPDSAQMQARNAEAALVSTLAHAVAIPMASAPLPHAVVIYPIPSAADSMSQRRDIAAVAAANCTIVVTVGRCVGIDELRRKYASARSLLPYVPAFVPAGSALDINDVPELVLLTSAAADARQTYLDEVLGPVASVSLAKRRRLQKTVDAVARHGKSPKAVSEETGFDIKTTRRHIEAFEMLTGLCLERPDHLRRLSLAVELEKLVRGVPPSG